jgi:hypothetical protein
MRDTAHMQLRRAAQKLYGIERLMQMKIRGELYESKAKVIIQVWEQETGEGTASSFLNCTLGYNFWTQGRHFFISYRYKTKNSYDDAGVKTAFENALAKATAYCGLQSDLSITKDRCAYNGTNKWIINLAFPKLKERMGIEALAYIVNKGMTSIIGGNGGWSTRSANFAWQLKLVFNPIDRIMQYYYHFPRYRTHAKRRVKFLQEIGGTPTEELLPRPETTRAYSLWESDKDAIRKEYKTRQEAYDEIRKAQRSSSIALQPADSNARSISSLKKPR